MDFFLDMPVQDAQFPHPPRLMLRGSLLNMPFSRFSHGDKEELPPPQAGSHKTRAVKHFVAGGAAVLWPLASLCLTGNSRLGRLAVATVWPLGAYHGSVVGFSLQCCWGGEGKSLKGGGLVGSDKATQGTVFRTLASSCWSTVLLQWNKSHPS